MNGVDQLILTLIGSVGVPTAIAFFCLYKLDSSINGLKTAVNDLKVEIVKLQERLNPT